MGTDSLSEVTLLGELLDRVLARAGRSRTRSVRSLLAPGRLKAALKLRTAGVAVFNSGRRCSSSDVKGLVVGLEVSTSCLSAANVEGSSANVRLPWRRVIGSWRSPCASCSRWRSEEHT